MISQPLVPDDADLVAIIGPQREFTKIEVTALENYLRKGGRLILALEAKKTLGLEKILQSAGIIAQNNFIKSSFLGYGYIDEPAIGEVFDTSHAITKVISATKGAAIRMEWPMDLKLNPANPAITQTVLIKTTEQATAFSEPKISEREIHSGAL